MVVSRHDEHGKGAPSGTLYRLVPFCFGGTFRLHFRLPRNQVQHFPPKCWYLPDFTVLHPKMPSSLYSLWWEIQIEYSFRDVSFMLRKLQPVLNVSHWQRWQRAVWFCQGNCTALHMRILFANFYTFCIESELVCTSCVYTIQLVLHGLCTPILIWIYKLVQGKVAWYFRSLKSSSYSALASLSVLATRLRLLQFTGPVAWFP